jgi:hypothetical protein
MNASAFDRLARTLSPGGSRRALFATAGAALGLVGSHDAKASAAKRCRAKDGLPRDKGDCHCAWHCGPNRDLFACHGNPDCVCYKDARGRGFCGQKTGNASCTLNSDCDPDRKCAVDTCAGNLCILPCST